MQASWFSRQGGERTRNSDAAAVGQQGQHVWAVGSGRLDQIDRMSDADNLGHCQYA
ncbi:hypothetical protein [Halomonas maura]|uniref:hypothetical protein n=1 Tax=Halomonas maura TaxID=117606 RepID=UPI0025B335FE|nr:hypothetical protein [Halomonas maura]MDN3554896.1 hypothetical protein [Halomonas maura]